LSPGTARHRVADIGDGLQIWRVAANILNKQSRTADRGWPSSFGVGRGANNPSLLKPICVAKYLQGHRKWMDSMARPKHRKMDMRFGTWNIMSLYRADSLKTVATELKK
jgi:hypothetical protein